MQTLEHRSPSLGKIIRVPTQFRRRPLCVDTVEAALAGRVPHALILERGDHEAVHLLPDSRLHTSVEQRALRLGRAVVVKLLEGSGDNLPGPAVHNDAATLGNDAVPIVFLLALPRVR